MRDYTICPFMSKPDGTSNADGSPRVAAVYCQKERCMAWDETKAVIRNNGKSVSREPGCRLIP